MVYPGILDGETAPAGAGIEREFHEVPVGFLSSVDGSIERRDDLAGQPLKWQAALDQRLRQMAGTTR